jgi:L-fucose isomerase-like protein
MVENFRKNQDVKFLKIEKPLIVRDHASFRAIKSELSYDIDALLVDGSITPLEDYSLAKLGLPIIRRQADTDFLRGLRVKKILSESKIIYVGEYPSFSIRHDAGPRHLFSCEDRFGVRVRQIEMIEFYSIFDSLRDDLVRKELTIWRKSFDETSVIPDAYKCSKVTKEEDLLDAVRVYLTLRKIVQREDANGVCVNCNRMWIEGRRHVIPCLAYDRLIDEGIMCACEGDMGNMISSLILHAVSTDQPVLQGNTRWHPENDLIYIQHGVIPLTMARSKHKIRNYHAKGWGITAYADIDNVDGPMTVVNIDNKFSKIGVIEGNILGSREPTDSEAREGHCRFRVNMSVNGDIYKAQPVLNVGSQHNSMTFGHWLPALKEAGSLLDLEVVCL